MRAITITFGALALAALVACQHNIDTSFPPGLTPLEDNIIPAQQGGAYTEGLRTQTDDTDYIHVYGRGFVLVSPAMMWTSAQDPSALVAVCTTNQQDITAMNDPDYEFSFLVHYTVNNILTVQWDDQWRGGVVMGTDEDPQLTIIKHQKIDGSSFITLSEGTIQLVPTDDPNVTELQFVEHLNSVGSSDSDVLSGVQHTYDSLVAVAHGNPIPACP